MDQPRPCFRPLLTAARCSCGHNILLEVLDTLEEKILTVQYTQYLECCSRLSVPRRVSLYAAAKA